MEGLLEAFQEGGLSDQEGKPGKAMEEEIENGDIAIAQATKVNT